MRFAITSSPLLLPLPAAGFGVRFGVGVAFSPSAARARFAGVLFGLSVPATDARLLDGVEEAAPGSFLSDGCAVRVKARGVRGASAVSRNP